MSAIAAWWKRHPIVRATLDNGRRVRGRFQYDWIAGSGEHLVVVQLGPLGSWRCYRTIDFSEKVFPWDSVEPVFAKTIPSEVQSSPDRATVCAELAAAAGALAERDNLITEARLKIGKMEAEVDRIEAEMGPEPEGTP